MGLTSQSTGISLLKEKFEIELDSSRDIVIALAGNPNTGGKAQYLIALQALINIREIGLVRLLLMLKANIYIKTNNMY